MAKSNKTTNEVQNETDAIMQEVSQTLEDVQAQASTSNKKGFTIINVNGKELKLYDGVTNNGDGTFTDNYGRACSNIGWHAGRFLGVAKDHILNAYKLNPELGEVLNPMVDELLKVIDTFKVVRSSKKVTDPEVLKIQIAKAQATMAKKQAQLDAMLAAK